MGECIKSGQQKQYCYKINKCHPTGLYIIHPHNFSSSVYQDDITTFPIQIYDSEKLDYPYNIIQESLYIAVAYMQKCRGSSNRQVKVSNKQIKTSSNDNSEVVNKSVKSKTSNKINKDKIGDKINKGKTSDKINKDKTSDKNTNKNNYDKNNYDNDKTSKRVKDEKDRDVNNKDKKDKCIKNKKDKNKNNKINLLIKNIGEDECDLETFDFPRYASAPDFPQRIRAAPKLVLTNGMIQPVKSFPTNVPIILRIAFTGVADTANLIILNDRDQRLPFRILSIDSMPITTQCVNQINNNDSKDGKDNDEGKNSKDNSKDSKECKELKKIKVNKESSNNSKKDSSNKENKENIMIVKNFLAAHMQRVDILFLLLRSGQYRLVKFVSPEELINNQFSTGTRVLLFINATINDKLLKCGEHGSGPVVPIIPVSSRGLTSNSIIKSLKNSISPESNCWMRRVDRKFRHVNNIAAWRNMRFNYPAFPMMEGAVFDIQSNRPEVWVSVHQTTRTHFIYI